MTRYLIEVEFHTTEGYKGNIRNKRGYSHYIERLRKTRTIGNITTQVYKFEWDYRIDPPIAEYMGNPMFKVSKIEEDEV